MRLKSGFGMGLSVEDYTILGKDRSGNFSLATWRSKTTHNKLLLIRICCFVFYEQRKWHFLSTRHSLCTSPKGELCTIKFVQHNKRARFAGGFTPQQWKRGPFPYLRISVGWMTIYNILNKRIKFVLFRQPSLPEDLRKYSKSMQTMTDCIFLSKTIFKRLHTNISC